MAIISAYQKQLSPLLPATCRYYPTCSAYGIEALKRHGTIKGLLMIMARLLRCQPFAKGGFDPVPEHFSLKRNFKPTEAQKDDYLAHLLTQQVK